MKQRSILLTTVFFGIVGFALWFLNVQKPPLISSSQTQPPIQSEKNTLEQGIVQKNISQGQKQTSPPSVEPPKGLYGTIKKIDNTMLTVQELTPEKNSERMFTIVLSKDTKLTYQKTNVKVPGGFQILSGKIKDLKVGMVVLALTNKDPQESTPLEPYTLMYSEKAPF